MSKYKAVNNTSSKFFIYLKDILNEDKRNILYVALLINSIMCAAGILSVYFASESSVEASKDFVDNGIGVEVGNSIKQIMSESTVGVKAIHAYLDTYNNCSTMKKQFEDISKSTIQLNPQIFQLEIDIAGVVGFTRGFVYPHFKKEIDFLYNYDILNSSYMWNTPAGVAKEKKQIKEKSIYFSGPYYQPDGFYGIYAIDPIFLPAPSYSYDFGCSVQPTDCAADCWDGVNSKKFYGLIQSLVILDDLYTGTHKALAFLKERNYLFCLSVAQLDKTDYNYAYSSTDIYCTPRKPVDAIVHSISLYNLKWVIKISPGQGWIPIWRDPIYVAVVCMSFLISILVYALLLQKKKHLQLLKSMLPAKIIKHLQSSDMLFAEGFDCVTILFADIVNYTVVASKMTPFEVVDLLDELYSRFDAIAKIHNIYKVETIGDSYMCAAGCPENSNDAVDDASRLCRFAFDIIRTVQNFQPSYLPEGVIIQVRVGMHSGSVVAGVVGRAMPRYCLFGDTVNTAARMESNGEAMRVHMSDTTADLLRDSFPGIVSRGEVQIKGKGKMHTYFLDVPLSEKLDSDENFAIEIE